MYVPVILTLPLKGTMSFAVQSMRRGSVIYMVDNPLYRGFWHQGKILFSNAVLMPMSN